MYNYFATKLPRPTPRRKQQRNLKEIDVPQFRIPLVRPNETEIEDGKEAYTAFESWDNLLDSIDICLKYLQGYWRPIGHESETDPWKIWLPFEFVPLSIGTNLYTTDGNTFSVKDIDNEYEGVYLLEGAGQPPTLGDILYVAKANRLQFMIGWPNAEDPNTYFTTEDWAKRKSDPWLPTITYRVMRVEPAGTQSYFEGRRQLGSRLVDTITYEDGITAEYYEQRLDLEIQFSTWDQTNEGAVRLAKWFKRAIEVILPVLRGHGLEQGHFWKQEEDVHLTRWRNDIVARSQVYRFRLGEVSAVEGRTLASLNASIVHVNIDTQETGEVGANFDVQV